MIARRAFGSTYRLQLNGFGFDAARGLVPFLSELGIDTLYLSPVTRARTGSSHGYDVADPAVVDPDLGGRVGYDALLDEVSRHNMTALLDIVPNHMAASTDNPYFRDVLQHGRSSRYAAYFDIEWSEQDGRVMLPVLGQSLDATLEAGELRIVEAAGSVEVAYFDDRFPVDPASVAGDPAGLVLRALLDRQHYVLADWRRANQELNYRRFFDINELIGVRQEDPAVFDATHRLIAELVADARVAGVRVDHVDGLRDPAGYLASLRQALGPDPVIEVEKILERDESLPEWPVDGTSGYEFAATVTGLFVDPDGEAVFASNLAEATADSRTFADRAIEAKRTVVATRFPHLVAQVADRLGAVLAPLPGPDIEAAVAELAVQLSVYRTYRRPPGAVTSTDRASLAAASAAARPVLGESGAAATAMVVAAFVDESPAGPVVDALARWQQLTPPATAKGVEDTAIYEPGRLLAVADVGSDPDHGAVSMVEFHHRMTLRHRQWPRAMSTLSTHDSKRSHDARCRLAVLSERAAEWSRVVAAVEAVMAPVVTPTGPDIVERRYLYETVIAVWPLDGGIDDPFVTRICDHMTKAGREAKRRSDWIDPDPEHEAQVGAFVDRLLRGDDASPRADLESMVRDIEIGAAVNSLASVVIRAAAPGVPDLYQGDDSWFFALVDPDNRRPLDVAAQRNRFAALPTEPSDADLADLMSAWRDGRLKQYVVRQALRARRRLGEFWTTAGYEELEIVGDHRDHVIGFVRRDGERELACIVPRFSRTLGATDSLALSEATWRDTAVMLDGTWSDHISGRRRATADGAIAVGSVLNSLPVALLERV